VTTLTRPRAGTGNGGVPARRAVFRWGWRLFRREWRQQLLVLGLLTVAVAATIWGASTVTNVALQNPNYPTFGTAAAQVTLPGNDPSLAADIAAIAGRWGPADVIENQYIANGSTQPGQLRAENPHGHYNSPLLGLVSGTYPAGPGQVALTSQVMMLLGSRAVQRAIGNRTGTLPGIPAAATVTSPNIMSGGISPAVLVLVVEVLGLVFIGLVSVAGFSVLAQRRLRALGMLSAIGATGRNLRLVMITGGLAVGVTAALAGVVLGFAAWFAYVPTLQQATGHVVDATNVPWWAFGTGVVFAIATSVLASRRPAKTMAAVPVVAALSGRPAPPKAVHRSALPGVVVFAGGVTCLAFTGGWAGAGGGGAGAAKDALLLLAGLVATIVGILLLAPLAVSVLAAGACPRLPVAVRIALRDLVRYRARSGAALAATTFAVFLATAICLVASIQFGNPLNWFGSNLSSSQLIVYTRQQLGGGVANQLSNAQVASLGRQVDSFAASLHAQSVPLEVAGPTLYQAGTQGPHAHRNGNVYVATPQLLATYGIRAGQISPGTDILTVLPGLAGLPHLEMTWGSYGFQYGPGGLVQKARVLPRCTLPNDCVANPTIQTISVLPSGTSAPNTVTTEYVVSKYHLQTQLFGWLIQAPAPLTATQISAAQHLALGYQVTAETKTDGPSLAQFADGATALGIVIALGVLAASVGLIRSETAQDLRTLTAAGASAGTRRMITAATAAGLGLLSAIGGMAGAVIAVLAWAHGSLSTVFGDVPLSDVLILAIGLPLIAAAAGWLLAGREPEVISRQPGPL